MAAENNVIVKADLAKVREVEFVYRFNENIKGLMKALGVTRPIPKQAGTTLKAYKAEGTLENGYVAEGDIIPLSKFKTVPVAFQEMMLQKYRKASTGEAILSGGYDQAVDKTDAKALSLVQNGIKTNFYDFLATGTALCTGADFQKTLANARAQLVIKFEDQDVSPVYFVNPLDVATYLGNAAITVQNAFGMEYIENFLGLGTVIETASVPAGTLYATAKGNIDLYYVPVNGANGLGTGFDFYTDETGLIGIHHEASYERLQVETCLVCGLVIFAERLDGVVVGSIGGAAPTATTAKIMAQNESVYGVSVADMQEGDVTIGSDGTISGTVKYLSGSNAITDVWGEGNFLAVTFENYPNLATEGNKVLVGLVPSIGSGLLPLVTGDIDSCMKITDPKAQQLKVVTTSNGHTVTKTYSLAGLTLKGDEA